MKKILILPLVATLLLTPQPKVYADFGDFAAGLFGVGICAAAVGAVGMAAHHLCQPLSDNEEIARGENLCRNSESTSQEKYDCYQKEFYIVPNEHPSFIPYRILKQFSRHIKTTSSYYAEFPFLDYKYSLDSSIATVKNKIKKINNKRSHLRKRQINLTKNKELTYYERRSYEQQYENLSSKLMCIKKELRTLQSRLENLRSMVITLDGYREDLRAKREKERIEKLEREIRDLRWELDQTEQRAREKRKSSCCTSLQNRLDKLERERDSFEVTAWFKL